MSLFRHLTRGVRALTGGRAADRDVLSQGVVLSVAGVTIGLAIAASWLPAWRASRIDPATTLRSQ